MIPARGSQTVLPIVYPKLLLPMLDSMCRSDDAVSSVNTCNSAAWFRGYSVGCILHLCRYKWWVWFLFHCRITNVRITCFVSDFTVDDGDYRNGTSLCASPSGSNAVRDALFAVSFVISLHLLVLAGLSLLCDIQKVPLKAGETWWWVCYDIATALADVSHYYGVCVSGWSQLGCIAPATVPKRITGVFFFTAVVIMSP